MLLTGQIQQNEPNSRNQLLISLENRGKTASEVNYGLYFNS